MYDDMRGEEHDDYVPADLNAITPRRQIPDFEGQSVSMVKAKLTSVAGMDIGDDILRLDQTVRLVVEGRVVRVDHVVHEQSGELHRVHTIKAIEAEQIPWDGSVG